MANSHIAITVSDMARQIATNTDVDREGLLEFIRPRHKAILSTLRRDDRPQMSPVTMGVDDDGRIVIATYPTRAKAKNARVRPSVSVCVISDDFGGPWVQVDGDAEVLEVPEAVDAFVEYYRNISGSTPTGTSTGRPWSTRENHSSG